MYKYFILLNTNHTKPLFAATYCICLSDVQQFCSSVKSVLYQTEVYEHRNCSAWVKVGTGQFKEVPVSPKGTTAYYVYTHCSPKTCRCLNKQNFWTKDNPSEQFPIECPFDRGKIQHLTNSLECTGTKVLQLQSKKKNKISNQKSKTLSGETETSSKATGQLEKHHVFLENKNSCYLMRKQCFLNRQPSKLITEKTCAIITVCNSVRLTIPLHLNHFFHIFILIKKQQRPVFLLSVKQINKIADYRLNFKGLTSSKLL